MDKIFVDTSGWVAFFVQNDKNHRKAIELFENLKNTKATLFTSDYVIDETITTILIRGGHPQSIVAGNALFTSKIIKIISIPTDYLASSWTLYKKYADKKFSFTDVTSFCIMKDLKILKSMSFDSDCLQAGFEIVH